MTIVDPLDLKSTCGGKHLHSWILQAAYDFMEMKAKGEKEADEDKNGDVLSDSREKSLYC